MHALIDGVRDARDRNLLVYGWITSHRVFIDTIRLQPSLTVGAWPIAVAPHSDTATTYTGETRRLGQPLQLGLLRSFASSIGVLAAAGL